MSTTKGIRIPYKALKEIYNAWIEGGEPSGPLMGEMEDMEFGIWKKGQVTALKSAQNKVPIQIQNDQKNSSHFEKESDSKQGGG